MIWSPWSFGVPGFRMVLLVHRGAEGGADAAAALGGEALDEKMGTSVTQWVLYRQL